MSNHHPPLQLRVWGEFACYSRPELKVERVSYPVMTPSAARGVLEAIFWKPEIRWQVETIQVLRPIRYYSILRNEINTRQTKQTASGWEKHGGGYYVEDDRTQRHTLALRDVAYIITAQMRLQPHADADIAKYRDQFRRRVQRGQCFAMPFLGCREFSASFSAPDGSEAPIAVTDDLGRMLLDMDYLPGRNGHARPRFFDARLEHGVLHVPRDSGREA